ncbi:txl1 [Candida pseudojiufengensis]|uniref:txl1 n=1 Tax=Candida pseudojiufengensis TaxID=497109 RepID=UPI0022246323|nr:txl1 [Candida pseudojiufengensis]KAI5966229.1 txl1 [Candida pseudojiufengensis]
MSIQFVKSTKDFEDYLNHNKYVIANFTASWCGPCQAIKPLLDQAYTKFTNIEIVKVDLDSQKDLARNYTVTAVPTFIFFESGKEQSRIRGANAEELMKNLASCNEKAQGETRKGNGSNFTSESSNAINSAEYKELRDKIPKGYDVLNSHIDFGSFEALNIKSLYQNSEVKDVLKLDKKSESSIISDSDSQILIVIPFLNISKIYSIFIKSSKNVKKEKLTIDEEDIEEIQQPNLFKIWPNKQNIISFEDASNDSKTPHIEKLDGDFDSDWIELKLKFVKFQNVQNLTIFIDGDDEDYHTIIDKIIIVGVNGESKEQKSLASLEQEE